MAGKPGMVTKNMSGAGLRALSAVEVKPFPWEKRDAKIEYWDQAKIYKHLAKKFKLWGVTRDQSAADLVRHLADHHWIRMMAMNAIQNGDTLSGKDPISLVSKCSSAILASYRALGVYPFGSVEPQGDEDNVPDFS